MKQETIKKIMEQIRAKENGNNEAKESVEEETMATMNMRSTTQEGGGLEKALNSNITTLNTYWYQFSPYPLNLMGTGGAVVGYLASTNYYYLAEFTMSLETAQSEWNLTKERLTRGYLVFTPELLAPGYSQFDITTKSNQLLSSWNSIDGWSGAGTGGTSNNKTIVLPISSIYDEESDTVGFKLWPYSHSSSIAGFSIEDMKFAIPIVGIAITTPPTKTEYLVGEEFDPRGMVVTATYSDGSTETVTDYTMTISGFNTNNVAYSQMVTISVTLGDYEASCTQMITVDQLKYEDAPYVRGSNTQIMDIYVPANLADNVKVPVVITIHGGNWKGGSKDTCHYHNNRNSNNDISDFITNTCNCVHVNMNYRLMNGGGVDTSTQAPVPYQQMLDDIGSVITYLQAHADIYHVDASKIALMGHSAGGHLALLYAYKNPTQIDLVISEAGPTHFVDYNNNIIVNNGDIFSMTGIAWNANGVYSNEDKRLLKQASPYWIVEGTSDKSIFPYTILASGNGVGPYIGVNTYEGPEGDGLIPASQSKNLEDALNPWANRVAVGTYPNVSEIEIGDYCIRFSFATVGHGEFGEGKMVCPNVVIEENDDTEVKALKTFIQDYYNTISNKLQELAQQEN